MSTLIVENKLPWNKAFGEKAVMLREDGDLPRIDLAGGMVLTLLSPTQGKLADLIPKWEKEIARAGLVKEVPSEPQDLPGLERYGTLNVGEMAASKFVTDVAVPNGSSIALLAEFAGRKVL